MRVIRLFLPILGMLLFGARQELHAEADIAFPLLPAAAVDKTAFAQWVGGNEAPIPDSAAKNGPAAVIWMEGSKPDFRGVKFGPGRETGVRHLRAGFVEAMPLGSVLVRGGGTLSVLKNGCTVPGQPG
jgi:hypothetical protein